MNLNGALEFTPDSESACLGLTVDLQARHQASGGPERRHGRRLLRGKFLRRKRRRSRASTCVDNARLLSAVEENALAERIKTGDLAAEQNLITANLRLVFIAVNDYMQCGVPADDLIQEGNLGLMRAARHFDPSTHTTRFATYAIYWIRCFIVRALASNRSLIHHPEQTRQAVCQSLGELTLAEGPAADHDLVKNEDRALVCAALLRLSPFEAWVISERFGLGEPPGRGTRLAAGRSDPASETEDPTNPGDPTGADDDGGRPSRSYFDRSYSDMGRECGLSVFRLRQVERTALDKLRAALAERVPEGP
jgi:RNA polymerase sigma factor (sigma-70 family)